MSNFAILHPESAQVRWQVGAPDDNEPLVKFRHSIETAEASPLRSRWTLGG